MSDAPRLRAGDADRDRILAILTDAHAAGRLDADELAERQDLALAARFSDDLDLLVVDLPEAGSSALPVPSSYQSNSHQPAPANLPVPVGEPTVNVFSVMSGKDLRPAPGTRELRGLQWWGGDNIDLSDCMGPGVVVVVELVAVMAGSTILVPPGVRVVDQTFNVMAGNSVKRKAQGDGSNGTLVLKGFSWWAGHDVKLADD